MRVHAWVLASFMNEALQLKDGTSLLLMSRVVQELLRHDAAKFDSVWKLPGE